MSSGKKTTSTQTFDPAYMAMATQNYDRARGIADQGVTPYSGPLSAGLTAEQMQAGGILGQYALNQPGSGAINQGILGAGEAMNYQPGQVTAGMLRDTDLSPYMSQYTGGVIDQFTQDQERARQIAQVNNNQGATGSGAFGGSRHGVLGALTNEGYDRNTGMTIAQLRDQAFQNAQGAATGDLNRQFGADQFNVNSGLAGNAQRMQGAGLLGQLGQQQYGNATNSANDLLRYGTLGQATDQAGIEAKYNEFLRQMNDPLVKQQLLNSSFGLIPAGSTTTQKESGSFLGGLLGALGSAGQSFASILAGG